jgi:hypothetical protein
MDRGAERGDQLGHFADLAGDVGDLAGDVGGHLAPELRHLQADESLHAAALLQALSLSVRAALDGCLLVESGDLRPAAAELLLVLGDPVQDGFPHRLEGDRAELVVQLRNLLLQGRNPNGGCAAARARLEGRTPGRGAGAPDSRGCDGRSERLVVVSHSGRTVVRPAQDGLGRRGSVGRGRKNPPIQ